MIVKNSTAMLVVFKCVFYVFEYRYKAKKEIEEGSLQLPKWTCEHRCSQGTPALVTEIEIFIEASSLIPPTP